MERSRYNYFTDRDDAVMGYNARTGNFTLMSRDLAHILKGYGSISELTNCDELYALGFLHAGDEIEQLEARFKDQRNNYKNIHLAILPTMDCNLRCEYCFQGGQHSMGAMSIEVQEAILEQASHLVELGYEFIQVSWYGGEPLYAWQVVVSLSEKLKQIFCTIGIRYEFTLVSNGTLLTVDMAHALAQAGVQAIQISVDALVEQKHRRGIFKSDSTYTTIIQNAINARSIMDVYVRVNADVSNEQDLAEMVKVLRDCGLSSISFARVHNFALESVGNPNRGEANKFLSESHFAHLEEESLLKGMHALPLMLRRLQPKSHFCAATSGTMIVIAPNGDITRCWETVGVADHIIGNILNRQGFTSLEENGWLSYSPFERRECRVCRVLPLCMGSCPNPVVVHGAEHSICESIRFTIERSVRAVATHLEISDEQKAAIEF